MTCTPLLDDRFLLLETLGQGGMGRVYRAFDRFEERFVALKVPLAPESPGPAHPLSAEYDAWSRLRHPNIIRAYELGRAQCGPIPAGTPYLVLESFAGLPAHRVLRPGRTDSEALEQLARRILAALAHVHDCGLVHRDLKPANVLVGTSRRGPLRTKLTDFGLAAEFGRAGSPGCLSGSVSFAAPESVIGLPIDGRTDLYGLGILLFRLATGKMPFDSRDPEEILRWHLEGPPIDPAPIRAAHSERLARLVRRLTCRDPEQRPASAAEALTLLGGSRVRARRAPRHDDDRADVAALRLALDSARLGARRVHRLPAAANARRSLERNVRVLSQIHGAVFLHLRAGMGPSTSNLDRVVLRMLVRRGSQARALIAKHRLHRGLPLALLGGLPLWDRVRPSGELETTDRTSLRIMARGIRSLLVSSAARRTTVLLVEPGALQDPLVRELVSELHGDLGNGPDRCRGGLLVLVPDDAEGSRRRKLRPTRRCNRAIGIARSSLPRAQDPPLTALPAQGGARRCR